jgi:predicted metal-dependent peptidase
MGKYIVGNLNHEQSDKFIKARVKLLVDFPFFAQLAMYLDPHISRGLPTAGVDPKGKLWINPDFIDKAEIEDMVFIIAHEVMHLVDMCHDRFPAGGCHTCWNKANDVAINRLILDSNIQLPRPEFIKPLCKECSSDYAKYDNMITEKIYHDMYCNQDHSDPDDGESGEGDQDGENQGGEGDQDGDGGQKEGPGRDCGASPAGSNEWWDDSGCRCKKGKMSDEDAAKWKQRAAAAAATAKGRGNMPGNLEEFMTTLLAPRQNWRKELRIASSHYLKGRWTWRKVGRRTAGVVRTPGRDPAPPLAVIYTDTSGSMSDDELQRCFSEAAEIVKQVGGKCRLLLGDAEIYYDGDVDMEALKKLPVQRGGTDFRPIFEKLAETSTVPDIFIGFTDLGGPFPDRPDFVNRVIWCVPKHNEYKGEAPWGRVIEVEL